MAGSATRCVPRSRRPSSRAWSTTSTTYAASAWSRSCRSRATRRSCSWWTCCAEAGLPGGYPAAPACHAFCGRRGGEIVRVLVVEDDPKVRDLLRRGLERQSFAVAVAADGTEALWRAGESGFDAIVLDVMLPDTDGFTVCGR